MSNRRIIRIKVDNIGWIDTQIRDPQNHRDIIVPIEEFSVNGEMAPVGWFRQGTMEYNGKYVIAVEFDRPVEKMENTTF